MIIAIDGYSSCGKSTLAKDIAEELDLVYVDTGAMYRAVTLYLIKHNIEVGDIDTIANHLPLIDIQFKRIDGQNHTFLNGIDVEDAIRNKEVSELVSPVATVPIIREHLVACQKQMAKEGIGLVMDGRDIGTVVFPEAEVKLFVTADTNIRTQRRYDELRAKGIDIDYDDIKQNLIKRDHIDSTRSHSPLRQAEDAMLFDNSNWTRAEQLQRALIIIKEKK